MISDKQLLTLQGLYLGRAWLSATERGDPELMALVNEGYAVAHPQQDGLVVWYISELGHQYLVDNSQTPVVWEPR